MGNKPILMSLYLMILFSFHLTTSEKSNFTDSAALLALKAQLILQPNDPISQTWTSNSSFCNWAGVTCDFPHQRATALNLSYMNLQGTISPYIGNLSFLRLLDFQNNSFHGQLPETIGKLRRLRVINVQFNQLGGNIPPSLSQCRQLKSINLNDNDFQGNMPDEIVELPYLETLQLRDNSLTGYFPFAKSNLSSLWGLDLIGNKFVGNIPNDICRKLPKLQYLYLSENSLGGQIPDSLCQCHDLLEIYLSETGLIGSIPNDFGCFPKLEYLSLGRNQLTGTIPPSLGNLSSLLHLELIDNNIWGEIPEELTRLPRIAFLRIGFNNLSGRLPQGIFNLSSAQTIAFMENNLTGNIPEFKSLQSSNLRKLGLFDNRLDGRIPNSISNATQLALLELSGNYLSGQVPSSLGDLRLLNTLNLQRNRLSVEPSQRMLHFLTSLTGCRELENLVIGLNPLNGELPNSIGNLSRNLQLFSADRSQIKGSLPLSVGNLSNLITFEAAVNNLGGNIPSSLGNSGKLQRLRLFGNDLHGRIPHKLCKLPFLGEFLLDGNRLSGPVPNCIGNLSGLVELSLSSNALESIPQSLWYLNNVWLLNLSRNSLRGHLPTDIEKLTKLETFDLSKNALSGNIPVSISQLEMLRQLHLANNSFQGKIPEAIGKMHSLESLELSFNKFSGVIPWSLVELTSLRYLNLSYNELAGEIPSEGIFKNFTIDSFLGNEKLCSFSMPGFRVCRNSTRSRWKKPSFWLKYIFPPVVSVAALLVLVIACRNHFLKRKEKPASVEIPSVVRHKFISYNELVHATDSFNEENLLGVGGSSSVYKGTLANGELIAVKVFNMETDDGFKSFDKECDVLRNVRHRNLLKIISSCSNLDFRALVFPFMPNGNLENLLHCGQPLEFLPRLNIMIDVALGVEYLHHGYLQPVVHCDLKPSNVLLDEDMVAHVGDFGIAKILAEYKSLTLTEHLGTIGYIAPENGLGVKASTKGDVYSYGIMLMEIFTRKRPTDALFSRGLSLRQWVMNCFPEQVMEIVDAHLFMEGTGIDPNSGKYVKMQNCLSSIMELALLCSSDVHKERPDMKSVVARLSKIKHQYI